MRGENSILDNFLWKVICIIRNLYQSRKIISAISLFFTLNTIGKIYTDIVSSLFLVPSGILSSVYFMSPMTEEGGFNVIHTSLGTIRLVDSCSGFSFFVIAFTMIFYLRLKKLSFIETVLSQILLALPVWIICIAVNSIRIVSALYASSFAGKYISSSFHSIIHMSVGMMIFIPALLLIYKIYGRVSNEKEYIID
ncbi:MAG TPA: hypothetical protein PLA54_10735 [Spirochaetota bacterium]|nr:hypothetical protein [Spirochaetota bacterium]HQE59654.1 hypothetical protein [Spirochaetota bacterium]